MVGVGLEIDLATPIAVLAALIFGIVQLRQYEKRRRQDAAFEVVRSFLDERYAHNTQRLLELPEGLTGPEIADLGPEVRQAIWEVGFTYETLGAMVYHHTVPLDVVSDINGSLIQELWRRIAPYSEWMRERRFGTLHEWFQWLAERLAEQDEQGGGVPAFEAHRRWSP